MDDASIGDGVRTVYEFSWNNQTRTTDELGDFDEAGTECDFEDVVDEARADDECDVRIIGFEEV